MVDRVLLAPDSFKGTFSAQQVAEALADGVRAAGALPETCALADGGEGTLDVLANHLGGERVEVKARDPLNEPIRAAYLRVDDQTAIVESALTSGLALVPQNADVAQRASTYGTGELIAAAAHAGARDILVTVGGTATTDGGAGAISAIADAGGLGAARVTVLCDVTVPFEAAATVFAPQKGAGPRQVKSLTARLHDVARRLPRDPRGVPRTGCAGGLSGALWAVHHAELVSGADYILDSVRFEPRAAEASLVITGEGSLDAQTSNGKLVHVVSERARRAGRPCAVVAGQINLSDAERQLDLVAARQAQTLEQITTAAHLLTRETLT